MNSRTFSQIFTLKKSKSNEGKLSVIYLRVTIDGSRTEVSTHRYCNPMEWNSKAGKFTGRTEEAKALNAYLDTLKFRVNDIYRLMIADGIDITCENFRKKFLGLDQEKPRMLIEIFEYHNKQIFELVGRGYSEGTYKRFKVCIKSLEEFLEWKFKEKDISIKRLNFEFINDYEFYLKTVRNCAHNTVMGYIKKIKKIVRQCVAKDWLAKDPFVAYKMSFNETHRTILTAEEIQRVRDKPFLIQRLDQVRDLFIFSCYTGLSYSDVQKLTPAEINTGIDGKKWIFTTRTKTNSASHIPLLEPALAIIEKYVNHPHASSSGKLLPVITNQRVNSYLKELADVCDINKELTFHCARHTFATTVTLSNGVPIETVGKMLGHRSLRTTQHYARILDRKVSDDMNALMSKLGGSKVEENRLIING